MSRRGVLRIRAIFALALIRAARLLLGVRPSGGDFDTCVHCKASGCEDGTAEHAPDCPSLTGVYVVTLQEMWPAGPACCEGCGTTLWPGDSYSHISLAPDIGQVACLGCVARASLLERE